MTQLKYYVQHLTIKYGVHVFHIVLICEVFLNGNHCRQLGHQHQRHQGHHYREGSDTISNFAIDISSDFKSQILNTIANLAKYNEMQIKYKYITNHQIQLRFALKS